MNPCTGAIHRVSRVSIQHFHEETAFRWETETEEEEL